MPIINWASFAQWYERSSAATGGERSSLPVDDRLHSGQANRNWLKIDFTYYRCFKNTCNPMEDQLIIVFLPNGPERDYVIMS